MTDVAIIGGGIAGLATAYELSRRGVSFVLLERGSRAGGVILSEEVDGFVIDGGPDALLIQKPDGIKLCEELGIGGRLVTTKLPRLAYIQRGGRLHPLPAASVLGIPTQWGPFVATKLFSWPGKMRMGAELLIPPRKDDGDESIGSFMSRRFGREAVTYLAEPLLAGIHAGDVDRLSVRALFPRFVEAERKHGSLLKAFRPKPATNPASRTPNPDGAFKSLPGGLSELVRAVVGALPSGTLCLNTGVGSISGDGPYRIERSTGAPIDAHAVVLATPAYVTSTLTKTFDVNLSRLCGEIPYASAATVALAFRRDQVSHPLNGSGFVVPRAENTGIMAGSWLSSKWPHRSPDDDHVLMRTFLGGARDPQAFDLSDEDMVTRSMNALRPLLGVTGQPLFTRIYRWHKSNAQHEVGHLDRLAAIERAVGKHPGLFVTGSGYRGTGIPDCVADGRATAKQVAEFLAR